MIIYIDKDYKCHATPGEGLTAVETEAFEGKCRQYIEGYHYVPAGQTWIREDGQAFDGEMISPAEDSRTLENVQAAYEEALAEMKEQMQDMQAALAVLGVSE